MLSRTGQLQDRYYDRHSPTIQALILAFSRSNGYAGGLSTVGPSRRRRIAVADALLMGIGDAGLAGKWYRSRVGSSITIFLLWPRYQCEDNGGRELK